MNFFPEYERQRVQKLLYEYGKYKNKSDQEIKTMWEILSCPVIQDPMSEFFEISQKAKKMRIEITKKSFEFFMIVYLTHYLHCSFAPFQREMMEDLKFTKRFVKWTMFRDSTKTTLARGCVLLNIVHEKSKNIRWVGYDSIKAKMNIGDIASELMDNRKIIDDYGQLYYGEISMKEGEKKPRTMERFRTQNGITVSLTSIKKSSRGILEKDSRPDFYVIDDVENEETKASRVKTQSIITNLGELYMGMSAGANILLLMNRITTNGVERFFDDIAKKSSDWINREVQLYDPKTMEFAWKERWCWTKKEEDTINAKKTDKTTFVKSVEMEIMNIGENVFLQEMMLLPKMGSAIFNNNQYKRYAQSDIEAKKKEMQVMVVLDPSFSTRKTADFFPIILVGVIYRDSGIVSEGEKIYFQDFYLIKGVHTDKRRSIATKEAIDMAFIAMHEGYSFIGISIEDVSINTNQSKFIGELEIEMQKRGLFTKLIRAKPQGEGYKAERIASYLEPVLTRGSMYIPIDQPNNKYIEELLHETENFPNSRHDDDIDVLAQAIASLEKYSFAPQKKYEKQEENEEWKEVFQKSKEIQNQIDSRSSIQGGMDHPLFQ